ncbi:MAG: hydroxyethylthiazole kinase, partial [Syntrophomonadaceae bacterium]|nr:hydroxyethylthiazole kinase [Syntrophomonadaceae bacterium]
MIEEVARNLEEVRLRSPLVHHLTNYVTVTDCANITLQLGALPVMADSPHEVEEMVALSSALVLNIGTISRPLLDAMLLAGRRANQLGIPVVLDPVGAGATRLRTDGSRELLEAIRFAVVKGNSSEIGALAGLKSHTRGVEAGSVEGDLAAACRSLAAAHHTVVVVSGARDLVVDADRTVAVDNGHPLMGRVTGTGCMLA